MDNKQAHVGLLLTSDDSVSGCLLTLVQLGLDNLADTGTMVVR